MASLFDVYKELFVRKKCLGFILVVCVAILVTMDQINDRNVNISLLQIPNITQRSESLIHTVYTTQISTQKQDNTTVKSIAVTTSSPKSTSRITEVPSSSSTSVKPTTTSSSKSSTTSKLVKPPAPEDISKQDNNGQKSTNQTNTDEQNHHVQNNSTSDKTGGSNKGNESHTSTKKDEHIEKATNVVVDKATTYVHTMIPSDYKDDSYLEPYCAMQSNSFKYLIWPDTPSDLTEWSYKRKRKCPKYVIPDNLSNTKRVKYSVTCDKDRPRLEPSITTQSEDVQVLALNDTCLAKYTNSCCNDTRGTPNIVHYVWYFRKEMKFDFFLSMLSIIRYVRPCLILFHGEALPFGKYWDYIIRIHPNIVLIKRQRPLYIFGKKISHHEHSGDIMRMDALMELGGMYFDTDVIVLRDLEPLHKYDISLCYQASGFMLNAFIMAKKNATFLTLWMDGYRKDYRNDSYVYNSMWYNKDLSEKHPELIHIEKGTLCAPGILIGKPINSTMIYNWSKLYGYHLYSRTIHYPWDVDWIKSFNATVGSMVRQVVYGNKELCD